MKFTETFISGVWQVNLDTINDDRGFFARTFCNQEFGNLGLPNVFEQSSLSRNFKRGTIRGMHYQRHPHAEGKFVRCVRGAIFDVAVDIREKSPTAGAWVSAVLSADEGNALYIAPGMAHGFQTLTDATDVLYQITPAFMAGHGLGLRWNDPAFGITWPIKDPVISERDASYPDYRS